MIRELSTKNRSLLQLSDKLRDLRFAVRRVAELPRQGDGHDRESAIYNMANALANVSNGFLNTAESGLISILSGEPAAYHHGHAPAYGFDRYFDLDGGDLDGAGAEGDASDETTRLRFVRDQYLAAKRVLLMSGNTNVLMHQENFLPVWQHCHTAFRTLFAARTFGHEEICRLAAVYTLAIAAARPVLSPTTFTHPHLGGVTADLNTFLAACLAIVAGVTAANEDDADSDIIYTGSIAAAMSRYDVLEKALRHDEAESVLAAFYARILHHLP